MPRYPEDPDYGNVTSPVNNVPNPVATSNSPAKGIIPSVAPPVTPPAYSAPPPPGSNYFGGVGGGGGFPPGNVSGGGGGGGVMGGGIMNAGVSDNTSANQSMQLSPMMKDLFDKITSSYNSSTVSPRQRTDLVNLFHAIAGMEGQRNTEAGAMTRLGIGGQQRMNELGITEEGRAKTTADTLANARLLADIANPIVNPAPATDFYSTWKPLSGDAIDSYWSSRMATRKQENAAQQ